MTVVVYTSALMVSDCHWVAYWRVCFSGDTPDRYICRKCLQECMPVRT
jgi:hypothetical protein